MYRLTYHRSLWASYYRCEECGLEWLTRCGVGPCPRCSGEAPPKKAEIQFSRVKTAPPPEQPARPRQHRSPEAVRALKEQIYEVVCEIGPTTATIIADEMMSRYGEESGAVATDYLKQMLIEYPALKRRSLKGRPRTAATRFSQWEYYVEEDDAPEPVNGASVFDSRVLSTLRAQGTGASAHRLAGLLRESPRDVQQSLVRLEGAGHVRCDRAAAGSPWHAVQAKQ